MGARVWQRRIEIICLFAIIWGRLFTAAAGDPSRGSICPRETITDSIFRFLDQSCFLDFSAAGSPGFVGVTEGDEVSLQNALNIVYKNSHEYVVVLFYASWCPFSRTFRPKISLLSSLYPTIHHFAIEESSVRPSILSKYGVHGLPTLFLLNSTMRVRYHGSRTLDSLVAFYTEITGIKITPLNRGTLKKIVLQPSNHEKHKKNEEESCPFTWARSPENLFRQETYLALAIAFVVLRLVHVIFPVVVAFARFGWMRRLQNVRLESLLEHPRAYLNGVIHVVNSLKEPCRKRNLHEGAINARAWASKSLATVSIGDGSTSRGSSINECR